MENIRRRNGMLENDLRFDTMKLVLYNILVFFSVMQATHQLEKNDNKLNIHLAIPFQLYQNMGGILISAMALPFLIIPNSNRRKVLTGILIWNIAAIGFMAINVLTMFGKVWRISGSFQFISSYIALATFFVAFHAKAILSHLYFLNMIA